MTKLLEKAFAQAARLPAGEQDAFGSLPGIWIGPHGDYDRLVDQLRRK